jgi:hypothetical protein
VKAAATGVNPLREPNGIDFGRQFRQINFRWLTPAEI